MNRTNILYIAILILLIAVVGFTMLQLNLHSLRMDAELLSQSADFPENGPVLLTGGTVTQENGTETYNIDLHWDGIAYLYFPQETNAVVKGSEQQQSSVYRGILFQLESNEENHGDYTIQIMPVNGELRKTDQRVYFGSYDQILAFQNYSVLSNYYMQGMCFAVMLMSIVLFLFKKSEQYLIWLALLAFFRGSYLRLRSLLQLIAWIPGFSVLTDGSVYLVLSEVLAAVLQYKIMESFMPVKIGRIAFPWYAAVFAVPVLFVYQVASGTTFIILFYMVLYACFLICFLRMDRSAVVEKCILLFAWALTVVFRFFDEFCDAGLIPSGDINIKFRLRGIASVLLVIGFFIVTGKKFAQKFQEADDLNLHLEEEIQHKTRQQTIFVRSMLHNLKTPLFSLSGYSDMALSYLDRDPGQTRKYIEKTREKATLAGDMMDRIFLATQMDSGLVHMQSVPVNISDLLQAVADTPTYGEEEKNISEHTELIPDVYITGDALYLRQAFQNLLDNARVNTPDGGLVVIRMEKTEHNVVIHVQDSGVGIPSEETDKIFEAYYSNRHGKQQSSGLGLYITKEIILRHNGKINVNSTVGEGSDFQVILPLPSVKM